MRKIRKRKTNQKLIYGIVFSAILFLTIGYSVLTTTLTFNVTTHKNILYEVGDKVEVLGLSQTFHVVEVDDKYLKLLCDSSVGVSMHTAPSYAFEYTRIYQDLIYFTSTWKSNIQSAGGKTSYYNVNLMSKDEIVNLVRSQDPTFSDEDMVNLSDLGLSWLGSYNYVYTSTYGTHGFYTSTFNDMNGTKIYTMVIYENNGIIQAHFYAASKGQYTYGMDVRPYLTIDKESVRKL